jgi:hypothetical protein
MVMGDSGRRIDGHAADGIDGAACDAGHVTHVVESISWWTGQLRGGQCMSRIALLAVIVGVATSACSSSSPTPAPAPRTASAPRAAPPGAAPAVTQTVSFTFTADHAAIVHAYYAGESRGPGNGRGRGGGLPPGIEKNLARGKPLPPGIAKQYLPSDLLVRLPTAPRGVEYVVVAGKLLLVEIATQMVREVLLEAVFG